MSTSRNFPLVDRWWFQFARYLGVVVLASLLSQAVLDWLNRFESFRNAHEAGQEWVHRQLASSEPGPLHVAIVDISSDVPMRSDGVAGPTDRAMLLEQIRIIARDSVAAIGVDVDFGPFGPLSAGGAADTMFFDECLAIARHGDPARGIPPTPIVLGVARTAALEPDLWLGESRWSGLAAGIAQRSGDDDGYDRRASSEQVRGRIVLWTARSPRPSAENRLPSLSARLAACYLRASGDHERLERLEEGFEPGPLARFFVEATTLVTEGNRYLGTQVFRREFFGEFSAVRPILKPGEVVAASELSKSGVAEHLKRKVVLLGIAEGASASDMFCVPGIDWPVAGVVVHASGVMTILRGPLLVLSHSSRYALSGLIALLVGAVSFGFSKCVPGHASSHAWRERFSKWGHLFIVLLGFAFCVLLVSSTRVRWDGFVLELAVFALLPPLELFADAAVPGANNHEE